MYFNRNRPYGYRLQKERSTLPDRPCASNYILYHRHGLQYGNRALLTTKSVVANVTLQRTEEKTTVCLGNTSSIAIFYQNFMAH